MLFFASKLVESALLPSNIIGFFAALGLLALLLKRWRGGFRLLGLSAVLLVIVGWSPLCPALLMPLEERFPAPHFATVPDPVDFRTRPADLRRPVASIADGMTLTDVAAHEWLGLLVYRLVGKTKELLPGR